MTSTRIDPPLQGAGYRPRSGWWWGVTPSETGTPLRQALRACHLPLQGRIAPIAAVTAFLAPTAAWAHPGHEEAGGLYAGIAHPLTGIDHLIAMLLVGVCAGLFAQRSERGGLASLALPGAFVGAMLAGFVASAAVGGTFAEPLILLSLVVLGAAVALRLRTPMPLALIAVAAFGFAHGMAHGFETPSGAFPALFAAGFATSTATLHGLGLWLVRVLPAAALRALGVAGAGVGLVLGLAG